MKSLEVRLEERSYLVHIGQGLLDRAGELLEPFFSRKSLTIITHPSLRRLYGDRLAAALSRCGLGVGWIEVPEGEKTKSMEWLSFVYDRLAERKLDRPSPVVAFGGGVVGDLAGFAAATYLRGVPFVQIPTTLLSQVDSSVGGKTGVNHPSGKNLIGAFYQPKIVLIDTTTLKTLPSREFKAGLSEVVKYGVIWDESLFGYLEKHCGEILKLALSHVEEIVYRSCSIKAAVVEKDETEGDLRSILNFGHTLGHAIEATARYSGMLHGEAVAVGMVAACKLSFKKGYCSAGIGARVKKLLERIGLPVELSQSLNREDLLAAMEHDKKGQEGVIKFVAVEEIGRTRFVKLPPEEILEIVQEQS